MENSKTLMQLRKQIENAMQNFSINELEVLANDNFIKIEGNFKSIDNVYNSLVKGELLLTKEDAEKFLKSLMQMNIICQNQEDSDIRLVVTGAGEIVFAKGDKELSWSDLDNYYRHLEMASVKSPLDLSLVLINLRLIYEYYCDIYEQVKDKIEYLKSFNSRLNGIANKKELIDEAKKKSYNLLSVIKLGAEEKITLYDEPLDIKRLLTSRIKADFSYSLIPLEHRKSYLKNLILSEYQMKLLTDRFTEELDRLKKINESLLTIIKDIASKNPLNLKEIDAIPEYNILDAETLLDSTTLTASQQQEILNNQLNSNKKEEELGPKWLEDIDSQQRNLSREEKNSLMLYKSFAYYVINQIISYVRNNNIDLSTIGNDENINNMLLNDYNTYVTNLKNQMNSLRYNRQSITIVDELFPSNHIVPFERYKSIILGSINPLLSSLSKVTLNNDMVVYRCVYVPQGQNFISNNLGNALLSTTPSNKVVNDFLYQRKSSINYPYNKVIYKIDLPAGSNIIAFTDDVYFKNGTSKVAFNEAQKEILLDSNNFDFEFLDAKPYMEKNGENITIVSMKAIPKKELSEESRFGR